MVMMELESISWSICQTGSGGYHQHNYLEAFQSMANYFLSDGWPMEFYFTVSKIRVHFECCLSSVTMSH